VAQKPRRWTGTRTPSALKRVRQQLRREIVNQPRRTAAKTHVAKTLRLAASGAADETRAALIQAVSALDRAARNGSIHRNAAARRKSRLMLKINAALGGESLVAVAHPGRTTGRAAAAKAARARVAASKATKAKGEQTAAGKARAALSRTTRGEAAPTTGAVAAASDATPAATRARAGTTAAQPKRAATRSRTTGSKRQTATTSSTRATGAAKTTRSATTKSGTTTRTAARSTSTKKPAAKTTTKKSR
jgi:small subunit ribosomal protein S20